MLSDILKSKSYVRIVWPQLEMKGRRKYPCNIWDSRGRQATESKNVCHHNRFGCSGFKQFQLKDRLRSKVGATCISMIRLQEIKKLAPVAGVGVGPGGVGERVNSGHSVFYTFNQDDINYGLNIKQRLGLRIHCIDCARTEREQSDANQYTHNETRTNFGGWSNWIGSQLGENTHSSCSSRNSTYTRWNRVSATRLGGHCRQRTSSGNSLPVDPLSTASVFTVNKFRYSDGDKNHRGKLLRRRSDNEMYSSHNSTDLIRINRDVNQSFKHDKCQTKQMHEIIMPKPVKSSAPST